jgi:predicted ATP-dependent serine protease
LQLRSEERNDAGYERSVGTLLSEVAPERVEWLWEGRIPKGKLTVVDGDPGTGKSAMITDLAARVSAGRPMPDGSTGGVAAGVVILSAEDGLADTVRPRLDAARGDPAGVLALTTKYDDNARDLLLSLPKDIPLIAQGIERIEAELVTIDPLVAYFGNKTDSHRDQDVRRVLADLAALAECAGSRPPWRRSWRSWRC